MPDIEPVRQFRTRVKVRSVERDTSPGGRWHDDGPGAGDQPLPLPSAFAVPRADDAEDLDIPYPCGLDQRAAVNGTYAPASSYRYRPDLDHGDDPLSRASLARLAGRPLR